MGGEAGLTPGRAVMVVKEIDCVSRTDNVDVMGTTVSVCLPIVVIGGKDLLPLNVHGVTPSMLIKSPSKVNNT